jgi:hypothetical protein
MDSYRELFQNLCAQYDIPYDDAVPDLVAKELQATFDQPLSYFQPKFVVEQCIAACKYFGKPLTMDRDLLFDAMENLSAKSESQRGNGSAPPNGSGNVSATAAKGIAGGGYTISK